MNEKFKGPEDSAKLAKRLMQAVTEVNKSEALDFINEVDSIVHEDVVKVPEPVFRDIFLPVFKGEVKHNQRDFIAHWMGIAGGPTSPVEVVDLKGDVIFTVPPIYDTERVLTDRSKGKSYSSMFSLLAEDSRVFAQRAAVEFAAAAAERIEGQIDNTKPSSIQQWKIIFDHYGITRKDATSQPSGIVDTDPAKSIEKDFEF